MADSSTPKKTGEVRCQYSGRWLSSSSWDLHDGSNCEPQFSTTHTDHHVLVIAGRTAPEGRFALIDNPATLDVVPSKQKSISIHSELMYTRSLFDTLDMGEQGRTLRRQIVGRP